jgi:hypothetical protein
LRFSLAISSIFRTFVATIKTSKAMSQKSNLGRPGEVLGRTELAQLYFPYIQPKSAWEKLRALLAEDPALEHLARLKRRTFLPAEVNIIYQHLGQP